MKGYTLIHSVIHGNVLGVVLAPKGTEDFPKDKRMGVWKASIRPLVEEIAEHEVFPHEDAARVMSMLFRFCCDEGVAMSMAANLSSD
jgi:hypothetical protein